MDVRYVSLHPNVPTAWYFGRAVQQQAVTPSPNGEFFFFLTHRHDLYSDSTVVELNVYAAQDVESWLHQTASGAPPKPVARVVRQSHAWSGSEPAIEDPHWDASGESILFMGITDQGPRQVHRLDVRSGVITQLTRGATRIVDFQARGDGLLYIEEIEVPHSYTYPVTVFNRGVKPFLRGTYPEQIKRAYGIFSGGPPRTLQGYNATYREEWMSPNGRFAIGMHEPPASFHFARRRRTTELEAARFVIADLASGHVEWVLGAPIERLYIPHFDVYVSAAALWSADSRRVVLVGTNVPGEPHPDVNSFIVSYEPESREWKVLEPLWELPENEPSRGPRKFVTSVGWLIEGKELLVTHQLEGRPGPGTVYSFDDAGIESREVDASVQLPGKLSRVVDTGSVSITLRQSANEPPLIVASNGRQERSLMDADPALKGISIAQSQSFQWTEPDGTRTGGLTLPRGLARGKPVPLVIQPYHYLPDYFLPDGHTKTPSAARQALAARGFAVLEMDIVDLNAARRAAPEGTGPEGERFVTRIDSAVRALVRASIADPRRVGLSGFSRAGYLTYYAITHPGETSIAASICADSYKGDYESYLFGGAFGGVWGSVEGTEEVSGGGNPFWDDPSAWLRHETSFNVHRVTGATLFTLHGYGGHSGLTHLTGMPTVGAFVLNRKPVEYLYFPEGDHQLQRPRERLAMMETTVDWMAFWLQDYEDPSPHKAAQYARWKSMRGRQDNAPWRLH